MRGKSVTILYFQHSSLMVLSSVSSRLCLSLSSALNRAQHNDNGLKDPQSARPLGLELGSRVRG